MNDTNTAKKTVINEIGEAALLEQLAEECAELAQAALKVARIIRHENPTPISYHDAFCHFLEEVGDVRLCVKVLEGLYGALETADSEDKKIIRWQDRLLANSYTGRGEDDAV